MIGIRANIFSIRLFSILFVVLLIRPLLFVAYLQSAQLSVAAQRAINKALAKELLKMEEADIAAGEEVKRLQDGLNSEDLLKRFHQTRRRNTARLKTIINQNGWPGSSLVGEKAARAAQTILQHSDHDRKFQKRCLPLLKEAGRKGEIELWQVAFLTDRIFVAEGKKQIYGTQFDPCEHKRDDPDSPCAIEDADKVDQRRREMGLGPLSEYTKMMKQIRAKSGKPAPPKP